MLNDFARWFEQTKFEDLIGTGGCVVLALILLAFLIDIWFHKEK